MEKAFQLNLLAALVSHFSTSYSCIEFLTNAAVQSLPAFHPHHVKELTIKTTLQFTWYPSQTCFLHSCLLFNRNILISIHKYNTQPKTIHIYDYCLLRQNTIYTLIAHCVIKYEQMLCPLSKYMDNDNNNYLKHESRTVVTLIKERHFMCTWHMSTIIWSHITRKRYNVGKSANSSRSVLLSVKVLANSASSRSHCLHGAQVTPTQLLM